MGEDQWEAWSWSCYLMANERPTKKNAPYGADRKTNIRTWQPIFKTESYQLKLLRFQCLDIAAPYGAPAARCRMDIALVMDVSKWWADSMVGHHLKKCILAEALAWLCLQMANTPRDGTGWYKPKGMYCGVRTPEHLLQEKLNLYYKIPMVKEELVEQLKPCTSP